MAVIKHSRQRDAIKTFLMGRKDHPTAEVVYNYVKEEYPNISLGTVYRNLSFLVDHGEAVKIPSEDGSIHFDATVSEHLHFQCRCCGAVSDIKLEEKNFNKVLKLNKIIAKEFPGRIDAGTVCFYGLCEKCLNK